MVSSHGSQVGSLVSLCYQEGIGDVQHRRERLDHWKGLRWFSCDPWTKGQHLEMRHCAREVPSNSVGRDQCPSFVTLVGSGEKLTIKDQQGPPCSPAMNSSHQEPSSAQCMVFEALDFAVAFYFKQIT